MRRQNGIIAFAALSCLLLCGATSPNGCQSQNIGPSSGELIGAAVGIGAGIAVGTIVLVEVHKSHHTVKGCVTAGSDGIQVHNEGDKKTYSLTGITSNVKVGDIVQVRGDKKRLAKGSTGDEDFVVKQISKDYGPCQASLAAQAGSAVANSAAPKSPP